MVLVQPQKWSPGSLPELRFSDLIVTSSFSFSFSFCFFFGGGGWPFCWQRNSLVTCFDPLFFLGGGQDHFSAE